MATTDIASIYESIDPEFTWVLTPEANEGQMTFVARNPTTDINCNPETLKSLYTESGAGLVTADTIDDCLQLILSTSVLITDLDPGVPVGQKRLHRTNPMMFPYRGKAPTAGKDIYKSYARECRVMAHGTTNKTLVPWDANRPDSPSYVRREYNSYAVDFKAIDHNGYLTDAETLPTDVDDKFYLEWKRNCKIRFQGYLDTLVMEGGQLQYAENPIPPNNVLTFKGNAFPAPIRLNERKGIVYLSWFDVPADYVLGAPGGAYPGRARQFERVIGNVNQFDFLGYGEQTLLLREWPEFVSKPIGVYNREFRANYVYEWQYDIHMKFVWFDPPNGANELLSEGHGHNLFAPKGQTFYLYATRPPANRNANDPTNPAIEDNPPCFELFDFRWLFQHADRT